MPHRTCSPSSGQPYFLVAALLVLVAVTGCEKISPPANQPASLELGEQEAGGQLEFDPRVVIANSFPAIVTPDSVTAAEADKELQPDELVLGVEVNGEARAYPINMLSGPQREIINDNLGGLPIAATW
jgi:hypothetical protein